MKLTLLTLTLCILAVLLAAQSTPEWVWALQAGGTGYELGQDICRDAEGNLYVIGSFTDTANFGPDILTSQGGYDVFISKLDPEGNWLWTIRAGGSDQDHGNGIIADPAGNVLVIGSFRATAVFGSTTLVSQGQEDIFVAKLDAGGNWLWAKRAGSADFEFAESIAADANGNCYISGAFSSGADFGGTVLDSAGGRDIFVAKLDAGGNWLWARRAGGSGGDNAQAVTVDPDGNALITGSFRTNADFGSTTLICIGFTDIFVAKLDLAGNWLWVVQAGGTHYDEGWDLVTDSAGNVYFTGYYAADAVFGPYNLPCEGISDSFVARLDADGNWLGVERISGSGDVYTYGIFRDSGGAIYLTGEFALTAVFGPHTLESMGSSDVFAAKLSADGNWLWAIPASCPNWATGWHITADDSGNAYLTGYFNNTISFGSHVLTALGNSDAFIAKVSSGDVWTWEETLPSPAGTSFLHNAWPNPFSGSQVALVKASVAEGESGTLSVHNLRGQLISSWKIGPGTHQFSLDGSKLPAGVYFYRLRTQNTDSAKKLVLLK
ncbi:MAG: SBBP repeat-containing protein [Candidatus Syntrophosphaera sp.]|nr:SBBP repeat-containing protein [Candidatus Syntrophosphaera sp.]